MSIFIFKHIFIALRQLRTYREDSLAAQCTLLIDALPRLPQRLKRKDSG